MNIKMRRQAECHPDRKAHGGGLCKRCYQREWFREHRIGVKCSEPECIRTVHARGLCMRHYARRYQATTSKGPGKQYGSLYPQAIVRVPVKGWGCVT